MVYPVGWISAKWTTLKRIRQTPHYLVNVILQIFICRNWIVTLIGPLIKVRFPVRFIFDWRFWPVVACLKCGAITVCLTLLPACHMSARLAHVSSKFQPIGISWDEHAYIITIARTHQFLFTHRISLALTCPKPTNVGCLKFNRAPSFWHLVFISWKPILHSTNLPKFTTRPWNSPTSEYHSINRMQSLYELR